MTTEEYLAELKRYAGNPKPVSGFRCPYCRLFYDSLSQAAYCVKGHKAELGANAMLQAGRTLGEINERYHLWHDLPKHLEDVDNSNCFTISYLQCCDFPAYQISNIRFFGVIYVWGLGGWGGGYSSRVSWHNLANPRPMSELYIHPKYISYH